MKRLRIILVIVIVTITSLLTANALFDFSLEPSHAGYASQGPFAKLTPLSYTEFQQYTANLQLPNQPPAHKSSGKLGNCPKDDTQKVDPNKVDCTYISTLTYIFNRSYRDVGQEMFSYLKSKGFDFQPGDKYKKEANDKLHNASLADNLSNGEPIIVDLYDADGNRVRVFLGDKGRTLPDLQNQGLASVADSQLVGRLEFYRP